MQVCDGGAVRSLALLVTSSLTSAAIAADRAMPERVSIDDVIERVMAGGGGVDCGPTQFLGLELTLEDFPNGWYDEAGVIDTSPSVGPGPSTDVKTAFAWNGGIDTHGNIVRGFKEDWNVFRLWARVTGENTCLGAISGSADNDIPFILDAGGSGFFHTTVGPAQQVNPALLQLWTGNVGDSLYQLAFDSFLTLGSATLSTMPQVSDPDNILGPFDATCDARVDGENMGITRPPIGPYRVLPDGRGNYRILLGQFTVRKGFDFSGQMLVSGPGLGPNFDAWSSKTAFEASGPAINPLGNAAVSANADGTLNISNIGTSGEDGFAATFDTSGSLVLDSGFGVTVSGIDLQAAGDGASIVGECDITDCFSTLFKPSLELENADGAIVGNAVFPNCSEVNMEFWRDGEFQGEYEVLAGNLFEIDDAVLGVPIVQDIACVGDALRVTFNESGQFRIISFGSVVTADEIRIEPANCSSPLLGSDTTGVTVKSLSVRISSVPVVTTTPGAFDPTCAGDVSPPGGNGVRNVDDLVAIILAFGACSKCPEDIVPVIEPNGVVDFDDLIVALNNFGPCLAQ